MTATDRAEWRAIWGASPQIGDLELAIRQPRPEDQGYITSTWMTSLARFAARTSGGRKPPRSDMQRAGRLVDRILDRSETKVLVAVDPHNTSVIHGWICWVPVPRAPVLHYIYVRKEEREKRIGSVLMIDAEIDPRRPFVWTMRGPSGAWITRWPKATEMAIAEYLR
jgi:hypothetical protein